MKEKHYVSDNEKLLNEWHPTKNGDLSPQKITIYSGKKVWWQCAKGHEWPALVHNRSKGKNCPYCNGRIPVVGESDLATTNPALAKEWHPTKNGDLSPQKVAAYANRKVWWQCAKGHEWPAFVNNRSRGNCCPYCNGRLPIVGETDLATTNPALAKEWHPTKNGDLSPQEVTAYSNKKVWWQCAKGHEWSAFVHNRSNGKCCPYCNSQLPIVGETDLATTNPALAKEWHPTKNGELSPQKVTSHSGKKVWWQCAKGHEWSTLVNSRSSGRNCPYCNGRLPIVGETDLATTNPALTKEWHPTKNGDLSPQKVTSHSGKKVWWQCAKGHEWSALINSRSSGSNCPYCNGYLPIVGETDLATTNPALAKEWHPIKNGELTPQKIAAYSNKKVWWQCAKGHEWSALVNSRSRGRKCPYCYD